LYFIEDLALGANPRLSAACTSQRQTWGTGTQGTNAVKTPTALHKADYNKTVFRGGAYYDFDPRPEEKRCTTTSEINDFVHNLKKMETYPMWLDIIDIIYDDYEVDEDRQAVLKSLSQDFLEALRVQLEVAPYDPFSNDSSVHFGATIDQANCDLWSELRQHRVTASRFQDFLRNPFTNTKKMLLDPKCDLSRVMAIQWGVENEQNAINAFAAEHGEVSKVGLFVSKEFPFLGASPDGLWKGCCLEVKCPFVLRHTDPWDIESLNPQQKRNYFCEIVDDTLRLKRSHKYFLQVQVQLFVTGTTIGKFIV
jgi:hypothetical protein